LTCPICGATEAWPIAWSGSTQIEIWRAEAGDRTPYAWQLCRQCGNGYPTAQPNLRVLSRIWKAARDVEETNPTRVADVWQQRRNAARAYAERSFRLLAPLAGGDRPGRFLDIACGLGETVRYFADRGWNAEGVDADPAMRPFHEKVAIRSRIGQVEKLEIIGTYDIIHIAHAIYFITDPIRFLDKLRHHLTPNGVLCVVLSDLMSSFAPSLPSYSHTFYPTAASMRYALALTSFAPIFLARESGSIYIAARLGSVDTPNVHPIVIYWLYRTQQLRFATIGRCAGFIRSVVKKLLGR
jgi:SAM-dependent methyltransferase